MNNMSSEHNHPENEPAAEPQSEAPPTSHAASNNESDSDSDTSDSDSTPQPTTEWLATTREKRSTAGNRMKSMIAQEEPDSDMELLFAEDEDDQGFSDAGADASDVHMDSSSDDEDENNAAADDLEGEKELERQAREKKAAQRKRKAQDAIPAKFRKKVRIDPATTPAASTPTSTATTAPAPRPKKKSERTSWLPTTADMPTRASSRSTTRLSKEQLHAQMEEREARRLKQLEQMQKKQARLEALKKPPMTQEERLREAEIVEKRNSKSLNRWEEAEKQREEERRAKLAALNERTLKGPVITFWSGTRQWKDGGAAKYVVMEEKPKRKERKPKDKDKKKGEDKGKAAVGESTAEGDNTKESGTPSADAPNTTSDARFVLKEEPAPNAPDKIPQPPSEDQAKQDSQEVPAKPSQEASQEVSQEPPKDAPLKPEEQGTAPSDPAAQPEQKSEPSQPQPESSAEAVDSQGDQPMSDVTPVMAMPSMPPPQPSTTATSGLAAPAQAQAPNTTTESPPGESETKPSSVLAAPTLAPPAGIDAERTSSPALTSQEPPKSNVLAPPNTCPDAQLPAVSKDEASASAPLDTQAQPAPVDTSIADKADSAAPAEGQEAPATGTTSTRNTIVYQNFDENAIKDKTIQTQILFGRKMNKLPKPSPAPLCVITNHPARYRDPTTGLPFYNTQAYREIQRLCKGEHRWSKILGAWAGSGASAAKGVPARFLNPDAPGPVRVQPEVKESQSKNPDGNTSTGNISKEGRDNKLDDASKGVSDNKEVNSGKQSNEPSNYQPVSSGPTQAEEVRDVQETVEKPLEVKA